MSQVRQAAENCVKDCMGIKSGEEVLIITDPPRLDLAELIRNEAKKLDAEAEIFLLPPPKDRKVKPLNIPSNILKGAVSRADVILNFFEDIELELRPFRTTLVEEAKKAGRIGHMIGVERSSFERGGLLADHSKLKRCSDLLAMILSKAKCLTIKSGSDYECELMFDDLGGWHEIGSSDSGILTEKGSYGNLPAGEAFMAISLPRSVSVNGKICIDNFINGVGHIDYTEPVVLTVVKGDVTHIDGYNTAEKFKENLKQAEERAKKRGLETDNIYKIAEIGIGTNPMAIIDESLIETEKRMNTLHIALGNNTTFGGTYKAPIHYDCVLSRVQLEIDGKIILEKGKLKDLNTLRREFEENYNLMDKTRIEDESLVTKVSENVHISDTNLYKKWTDFEGRTHLTKVGDDISSQKVRELWKCMENQDTVGELLDKTDYHPETIYQLLRLLEEYLLVDIKEKTVVDYIKQIKNQTGSNFFELSKLLAKMDDDIKEDIFEQQRIYLSHISNDMKLLQDSLAAANIKDISEKIRRIESHTNELLQSGSEILSSKLAVSAGLGPFLNISGEIDLKELLGKIRKKLCGIKRGL